MNLYLIKKLVWLVTDCHKHFVANTKEWKNTKIVFEITEGKLTFSHIGLQEQLECYSICCNAWDGYLFNSLKPLLEKGTGKADKKAV